MAKLRLPKRRLLRLTTRTTGNVSSKSTTRLLVLYVRGDAQVLSQPGIAVVGTRHPTPYGSGMAERLSIDLVAHGLAIFSGMARGVDTAAHRGAVAAKGKSWQCSALA